MQSYLDAINLGAVPNIENAWNYLCRDECTKAVGEGLETYERMIKEVLVPKIPTTLEELKVGHRIAKEAAIETYKKKAIGDVSEEYVRELVKRIKARLAQIRAHNERESNVSGTEIIIVLISSKL